jgi:hypothetical protein
VLEGERAALRRVARGEDEGEREGRVEGCELEEAEDGVAGYACLRTESVLGPRLEVCMSREIFRSSHHDTKRTFARELVLASDRHGGMAKRSVVFTIATMESFWRRRTRGRKGVVAGARRIPLSCDPMQMSRP